MRKMGFGVWVLGIGLLLAQPVQASEFYEENPAEVAAVFKASAPKGSGVLRELMLRAYEAAYWEKGGAKALSLTYFWDIEGPDIVARTMKEMKHVRPDVDSKTLRQWEEKLQTAIPSVKDGERITAMYLPAKTTTIFYHQGKKTADIKGRDFADAFFAIWLDEATNAPDLRAKLLGE